jgi:hypothetical protein
MVQGRRFHRRSTLHLTWFFHRFSLIESASSCLTELTALAIGSVVRRTIASSSCDLEGKKEVERALETS